MPGMVDVPHEVYLGHGATLIGPPTDLEEAARIDWVPLDRILDMAKSSAILGSGSLVGLLYLLARRQQEGSGGEGQGLDPPPLAH